MCLLLEKDVKGSMIHFAIRESFSDRSKNPQVGIEHRSAEKASLSCVERSHWSRLKERDPHKTKADKPFRLLLDADWMLKSN